MIDTSTFCTYIKWAVHGPAIRTGTKRSTRTNLLKHGIGVRARLQFELVEPSSGSTERYDYRRGSAVAYRPLGPGWHRGRRAPATVLERIEPATARDEASTPAWPARKREPPHADCDDDARRARRDEDDQAACVRRRELFDTSSACPCSVPRGRPKAETAKSSRDHAARCRGRRLLQGRRPGLAIARLNVTLATAVRRSA